MRLLLVFIIFLLGRIEHGSNGYQLSPRASRLMDYIGERKVEAENQVLVIIDGDNVRGKTRFRLSKDQLCVAVQKWLSMYQLQDKVCLLYDHGSKQCAYQLSDSGLVVAFSGEKKVDDIIVRDIQYYQSQMTASTNSNATFKSIIVVTEDRELKKRCRKVSLDNNKLKAKKMQYKQAKINQQDGITNSSNRLFIVDSPLYAEMMMEIVNNHEEILLTNVTTLDSITSSAMSNIANVDVGKSADHVTPMNIEMQTKLVQKEVEIRKKISNYEALLRRSQIRKKKIQLNSKLLQLRAQLSSLTSLATKQMDKESEVDSAPSTASDEHDMLRRGQELIEQILKNRQENRSEETWERVINAEIYRLQLEKQYKLVAQDSAWGHLYPHRDTSS